MTTPDGGRPRPRDEPRPQDDPHAHDEPHAQDEPQPRDIALEQGTPEMADELEIQSESPADGS